MRFGTNMYIYTKVRFFVENSVVEQFSEIDKSTADKKFIAQ